MTANEQRPPTAPQGGLHGSSKFSMKLAMEICNRLIGGESLRRICRDDNMPDLKTVWRWLQAEGRMFDIFRQQYASARVLQAETFVDEIVDIADDGCNDYVEREIAEGVVVINPDHEHLARSKLRIDTRKWYASKVLPKIYGDTSPGAKGAAALPDGADTRTAAQMIVDAVREIKETTGKGE